MSRWKPCKRRDFIRRLRSMGFQGPWSGARHQFLVYRGHRMAVPSNEEFSVPQVRMLVGEVEAIIERNISADEWDSLL